MGNVLVTYFSASGSTRKVAKKLSEAIGATLFEIKPVQTYTGRDLNWNDKNSRSTLEMNDKSSRPAIAEKIDASGYDTIFIGFPIWWYTAPRIINTFLESGDFSGKKIILFATSGGSGLGNTAADLKASAPNATIISGKIFRANANVEELKTWAESYE